MQAESFDFRPSKVLIFFLVIIHVGTLLIILSCPSLLQKVVGTVLCVVSFLWNIRLQFGMEKIHWNEKDGWVIENKKGRSYPSKITRRSICLPWVVGLNFNRKPLIVFFDSMSRDAFRRLRVLLINKG